MAQKKPNTKFNWFEIFRAGKHTDSKGNEAEFSKSDLQSVVENFKPRTSPLVIGHPKNDDPAWGWAEELKIEDDVLYAKAEAVDADFAEAVENARYPNRSVRLRKTDNGFELGHIGFLGGKPPAVDGMQWLFSKDESGETVVLEFAASDRIEQMTIDNTQGFVRLVRNLKTLITDKFGAEEANNVFSEWEAEHLQEQATLAQHEKHTEQPPVEPSAEFSAHINTDEENTVTKEEKEALEAKLKDEQAKNAQLQFNQAKYNAQTFIDQTVNGGKAPRLTNTDGLAEFMAHLETGQEQTFEFAAADGEQNTTVKPAEFFKSFLQALPEQKGLTKDFSKDDGGETEIDDSAEALAAKALDFQQSQASKGVTISISAALEHVQKEAK
ncbi:MULTISPECIES: hypothetical protein [Pseudoalteromonas]|uniref:Peptidase n=1 Tax=Pseudoalteromonas amylolytica TaxID=1859457 RepID=A0A1S1MVX6_9GAMM|nr:MULTISPECIES: hypothetical protein [Pseudoalteromonas]OHU85520.1 hypothetical protein BFC16_19420 [Pseudoalteromonas sp. JW3]OHU91754.1 hypothetical protein BET10_08115 [Pseudoalteromonas amylolytica]